MAAVRTIDFLPRFFKTDANNKFLSATLDQLVTEPSLTRLNGYAGRKNGVNYSSTDNYITEGNAFRTNYQLEPSVTSKDSTGAINFVSGYQDVINKLGYYGVDTTDHSRLFANEYYTYDGLVDFDKFVNFSQYYWLPNGPDSVSVSNTDVPLSGTFTITTNTSLTGATIVGKNDTLNPTITLVRGGSYTLKSANINNLYIQSEPGVSGFKTIQSNVSSREVLGVYNNGTSSVIINVPEKTAQDQYVLMTRTAEVDLATTLSYTDINGKRFEDVAETFGGIDSQRNLPGKLIIFLHDGSDFDNSWTTGGKFDSDDETFAGYDNHLGFDYSIPVAPEQRYGIWQINNNTLEGAILELTYVGEVPQNTKVLVREGALHGNREYFKNSQGRFTLIPVITAIQDRLFYQDADNANITGIINLVDPVVIDPIKVTDDILGKVQYISEKGVVFTNGLKVRFDSNVIPSSYANKSYYVEGVGTSIKLIDVDLLTTPEPFTENEVIGYDIDLFDSSGFEATLNAPVDPLYITINRSSIDLNPWSRNNRWFHQDIIALTSTYNNYIPVIDQAARAQRPIIEFDADLQLFNFGKIGKASVTLFDTQETDALSNVEGQASYTVDGIELSPGMRVIFSADAEDTVKNKIYEVSFIDPAGDGVATQIHLTLADDGTVATYDSIVVTNGVTYQGTSFWFNGSIWTQSQQKTLVNQEPVFDVFDSSGSSLSNTVRYPNTNFTGTKIISYKRGTGINDTILGFPLSYRNFNNIGDIVYNNNYNLDTFSYTSAGTTVTGNVSAGLMHRIVDRDTAVETNVWRTVNEESKQYQLFSFTYTTSKDFAVRVSPSQEGNVPNSIVYVNNVLLTSSNYEYVTVNNIVNLRVNSTLSVNDRLDVYVYSTNTSTSGYYQVPQNLNNNSVNVNFETLTLGQFRNHVEQAYVNSNDVTGVFPGSSNIRDILIKDNPGKILQHSAPATYASLFLTNEVASFTDSIDYSRREYVRFKNKFLEFANSLETIDYDDIPKSVDLILEELTSYKTSDMPFYASDMVPYGSDKNTISYIVYNDAQTEYEITTIFSDSLPSNKAVLVYLNGVQLTKGTDYTFSTDRPAVVISKTLVQGNVIVIEEFNDTDGSWIPDTPSKLGLYPLYSPEFLTDSTYRTPQQTIRGHDGSITIAFGDFRDDLVLELEKRIYNNVKVVYDPVRFDIKSIIPGKFRDTAFSVNETNKVLSKMFLKWVGTNRLDYITNTFYENSDGFTWNYSNFTDKIDGERLLGAWRGIYQYFYDTEYPHLRPWEMLGFSERPSWWVSTYGPAPYTSGNTVLWGDLERGYIASGTRAGINLQYARPGLSAVIPVNEYGDLLSPHEFIVSEYQASRTNVSYTAGDIGPVEAAWRKSSEYPYAVQELLALTAPGKYFGLQLATYKYARNTTLGQYLFSDTNLRITQSDVQINGETYAGVVNRSAGYLNFIADYVRSLGLSAKTAVGDLIDNFDVNLSYKIAGFTDKNMIKVFAEQASPTSTNQSILVPDSDYSLALNKSVPLKKAVYSAVVVTKTNAGWSIEGYDSENPYFTIIPSDTNGKVQTISVAGVSAYSYSSYKKQKVTVPYGYEFTSRQQVVDFLLSYERFLKAQGFRFNQRANEIGAVTNWTYSSKEFLTWSEQGWNEGNIIVLSPVSTQLTLETTNAVVDRLNGPTATGKILNINFVPMGDRLFSVSRINSTTTITLENDILGFAELTLVQYEHVAVFNNITVFNDIIYQPELGNRQSRLKFVGKKTADWNGTLNAPGFILNQTDVPEWQPGVDYKKADLVEYKGQLFVASSDLTAVDEFNYTHWTVSDFAKVKQGLLPNFSTKSKQISDAYNLENINLEDDIDVFSKGLIGFRQRNYLNDLGLDDVSQVKFYQGYIKEKGTKKSIESLTSATIDRLSSNIAFYEDWAFRIGEYGAIDSSQVIEVPLNESQFSSSPSFFTLLNNNDTRPLDRIGIKFSELHKRPRYFTPELFLTRDNNADLNKEMKTAGPVRIDDTDFRIFDLNNYTNLDVNVDTIGATSLIWTAKDFTNSWNVFRVDQTNVIVGSIFNSLDGYILVETTDTHGLAENDVIVLKNISAVFNGVYKVVNVPAMNSILLEYSKADLSGFTAALDLSGYILKLKSMKYEYASDITAATPVTGWTDGDTAWVTDTDGNQSWAVYNKTSPWEQDEFLREDAPSANSLFGSSVSKSADNALVIVGKPGEGSGKVVAFELVSSSYIELVTVTAPGGATGFGNAISQGSTAYIAIAASATNSNRGAVYIYTFDGSSLTLEQTLTKAGASADDAFGTSIAMSSDSKWLYVGTPGSNQVFAYGFDVADDTYKLVGTITASDSAAEDDFGFSVATSTDGAQVVIGAPGHDTLADASTVTNSGCVYVFDRSVEAFSVDASTTTFTATRGIQTVHRVTVDLVELDPADYTWDGSSTFVTLDTAPGISSVVRIETNEFNLMQKIYADNSESFNTFGYSVQLCPVNCSVYVGAPNDTNELVDTRGSGEVYRFANQGRVYGTISGTVTTPTVTIGHTIRIDDFEVAFTGTTLAQVVEDINNADLVGITASAVSDKLLLVADSELSFAKLRILPGTGTALTDLGLTVFPFMQYIENPDPAEHAAFGQVLAISDDAMKLAVGCPSANTTIVMQIDGGDTYFDSYSTTLNTVVKSSGAAYVYEFLNNPLNDATNPGKFIFAQRLISNEISTGDLFGTSLLFADNRIIVGMPGDDTSTAEGGQVAMFTDANDTGAWNILRSKSAQVDIEAFNRLYLYNTVTGEKLPTLDYIDPAKGKILGQAAQEIDFISDADPAYYTTGSATSQQPKQSWAENYVGCVWWDTTDAVWLDYEQGEFAYRSAYWAKLFPGATVNVYEWMESSVPPATYLARSSNGVPRNTTEYTTRVNVDKVTGEIATKYYFWVTDTDTIPQKNRKLTTSAIENAIANPQSYGIPYVAILSPSTVGLWNISEYLVDSNVIISIDYDVSKNDNLIHSEYALIQEGNATSAIPDKIIRKMIDSLCGSDAAGNTVPDPTLPAAEKYGISFRPRQSVFVDSQAALKLTVDNVNTFFATLPILSSIPTDGGFYSSEPTPNATDGGYSETVPDLVSLGYLDIASKAAGYKVLVTYDSNIKGWSIYERADGSTLAWTIADSQSYNTTNYWTTADWSATGYETISRFNHVVNSINDVEPLPLSAGELIKINDAGNGKFNTYVVNADLTLTLVGMEDATIVVSSTLWEESPATETRAILTELVKIFTGTAEINQQLFALIRYALSEQKYLDWAFKTSFITVLHKIRKLEQYANYQKDNQNFVQEFINEVKPYRTKVREYLLDYEGDDLWNGDMTDFDLPGYYDVDFLRFRSPSGESNKDPELLQLPEYTQWNENHGMYLSSVVVETAGTGYDIAPQARITGGGGSGATAFVEISNGGVRRIRVLTPGSGYTSNPTITLTGGNGTGATASIRMANNTTRKISTTIKFDRTTYSSDVTEWAANTAYSVDDVVAYDGEVYTVTSGFTSTSTFDGTNLTVIADESFNNANDRTLAYYQPTAGMPNKVLGQLFSGINYPGVTVIGGYPINSWAPSTSYTKGDLIARTSDETLSIYRATADFTSESSFTTGYLEVATVPGLDGKQQLPDSEYDSLIRSTFTDLTLGTRPQDINIDGGDFVDTFVSHAPEELIPGIVFDSLDMKVFTLSPATETYGAGPQIHMHAFRGDGSTVTYDVTVAGGHNDNVLVYTKQSGYRRENVGYTYDRIDRTLTFTTAPASGDSIYIYLLSDANLNQLHDEVLVTDGSTTVFDATNTEFSRVGDSFITINGVKTTAYTLSESDIVGTSITFDTAPAVTDHVHVYLFGDNGAIQSYSEFYTQFVTTPADAEPADAEYNNGAISNVTGNGSDFFKREVTVNGVRIVAAGTVGGQTAVPDAWLEKVARMFELFLDKDAAGINETAQRNVIKTLSGDAGTYHAAQGPTLQRVARGAGSDYTPNFLTDEGIASWNLSPLFDTHVANDMVWYLNSTGDGYGIGEIDAQEVIEHVFHTLHMHGLDAVSLKMYPYISADWATGPLYAAMVEAYDGGFWDPAGYGGDAFKTDGDAFEVAAKEYLYLLNFSMFEYTGLWDGDSLAPEWTDTVRTSSQIQTNLPLGYALFNSYIAPVISKPSLATINSIFGDGNTPAQDNPALAGVSGYVVDALVGGSPVYPADYTIDLDRELKYAGPFSANIVVEVNNVRLRPANNRYYTADGSTLSFFIPTTVDIDPDTISDNDISVYVNGDLQLQNIDYDVIESDGSSLRQIEFYSAPDVDSTVTVSLQTGAEFRMNSNQQLLIDENFALAANATVKIVSLSNHDMVKMHTQVFIGSTAESITSEPGFDEGGFEAIAFDADSISVVSIPVYTLERAVGDTNYVWATVNGVRMLPNYDFVMRDPNTVQFGDHLDITGTDTVIVTTFTEVTVVRPLGFRIFQNMIGDIEYLRISEQHSSTLSQDLAIGDDIIHVADASVFAEPSPDDGIPGVVYIGAERITYYTRDLDNNTLGRLRRATGGTGSRSLYEVTTPVVDGSADQTIPGTTHTRVWLNAGAGTPSNGTGLSLSTTAQANFLKSEPSYLPG